MAKKKIPAARTKGVARVPVVMQLEALECGAASLAMVMAYYGKWVPLEEVRVVQRDIVTAYVADMTKYATTADAVKILSCWDSLPAQLAKESDSTKFSWKLLTMLL